MANTSTTRFLAVSLFLISTCVKADPPSEAIPPVDQLAAASREAKDRFRPLDQGDLQAARKELVEAFERLERRLSKDGENGDAWAEYLQSDKLQEALRDDSPLDLSMLAEIDKRFEAEHEGLELVWFVDVHQALQHYRDTAGNIDNPKLKPAYEALLDALAKHVEAHAAKPTAEEAIVIGQAIGQLEDARQVPQLVRAIRYHFAKPNLFIEVSADLISNALSRSVDETVPVRDVILGAQVCGTGHTTGQVSVTLLPDTDRAAIHMVLQTTTESQTVARKGDARIHNNGITTMETQKSIWVDKNGYSTTPAVSDANTRTKIVCVRSARGSEIIERFARKRAAKQKPKAECIGALHAERRANKRLDKEVGEKLAEANAKFVNDFRAKLLSRKLFPQMLDFQTTEQALKIVGLKTDASRLAAPTPPPELPEGSDIAIRVHESMIGNYAAGALAGRTLNNEQLERTIVDLLGRMPKAMEADEEEDNEDWSVSFDRLRPITVSFADGKITLVIRGRKYTKGNNEYPAMNTTAVYEIKSADDGFKAVRQGDLVVLPPGFDPQSGEKMSTSRVVIRRLLQRRMGKLLTAEIELGSLALREQWRSAGELKPSTMHSENGWLTACWQMVAPEPSSSPEPAAAP